MPPVPGASRNSDPAPGLSEPQAAALRGRIQHLEESLGYADRRTDQLHEELVELSGRLDQALRRLAKLEGRVEALAESPEPEPPAGSSAAPDEP